MFKEGIIDITPNHKGEIGFLPEITGILEGLLWLNEKDSVSCTQPGSVVEKQTNKSPWN